MGKKVYVVYDSLKNKQGEYSKDLVSTFFGGQSSNELKVFGVFDDKLEAEKFVNTQNAIAEVRKYNYLELGEYEINTPTISYKPAEYICFMGRIRSDGKYLSADFKVISDDENTKNMSHGISKDNPDLSWAYDKSNICIETGKDFNFVCYTVYMKNTHPAFTTLADINLASKVILLCINGALVELGIWDYLTEPGKEINWSDIGFHSELTKLDIFKYVHCATTDMFDVVMRKAMKSYNEAYVEEYSTFISKRS